MNFRISGRSSSRGSLAVGYSVLRRLPITLLSPALRAVSRVLFLNCRIRSLNLPAYQGFRCSSQSTGTPSSRRASIRRQSRRPRSAIKASGTDGPSGKSWRLVLAFSESSNSSGAASGEFPRWQLSPAERVGCRPGTLAIALFLVDPFRVRICKQECTETKALGIIYLQLALGTAP